MAIISAAARGVVSEADAKAGKVPVIAPAHFMEEAISENVIAGPAMTRRADYMFGWLLPRSPTGHVSLRAGAGAGRGTVTLVPPNDSITRDRRHAASSMACASNSS